MQRSLARIGFLAAVLASLPALALEPPRATSSAAPSFTLEPCRVPGIAREVKCGTYEVFENRAARAGRKIGLKVVVVSATGKDRLLDPFVFLHGGPGAAATQMAAPLAAQYAEINARRDIFLMDQRGTGGSHPLDLDLYGPPDDLRAKLGEFVPPKPACEGAAKLARESDLTQYTTPIAVDDLDEVRAALGYDKLNLFGASYGTRAAMAYLKQHPDRVRTVVLQGVSRFDDHLPIDSPRNTQRALDGLVAECAEDAACHAAFPSLAAEVPKVLAKLEAGPVGAQVLHPGTGEVVTLPLTREVAAEALRYMLYMPSLAVQVPVVIHQAAGGDWGPLTEMAIFGRLSIIGSSGMGMFLAVMCSEDIPFIDPVDGDRRAEGTFMGATRLHQLQAACRCVPPGPLPADYAKPVRSDAPALVISGQLDPATPPSNGAYVASFLRRSRHVVVPQAGHDTEGMKNAECLDKLIVGLVTSGTSRGLDTSCIPTIRRQPFVVKPVPSEIVSLPDASLDRLAGRFVAEGQPLEITVTRVGNRLRLDLPNDQRFVLAPLSEARFKIVGPPGFYAGFTVTGGVVKRLEIEQGGAVALAFVPQAAP